MTQQAAAEQTATLRDATLSLPDTQVSTAPQISTGSFASWSQVSSTIGGMGAARYRPLGILGSGGMGRCCSLSR